MTKKLSYSARWTFKEREAFEAWRNKGNRGKPPPQLMQFDELPECYQSEEPFEVREVDEILEGCGQRRRNVVIYTDGLSDDAWALVCSIPYSASIGRMTVFSGSGRGRRSARTRRTNPREASRVSKQIAQHGRQFRAWKYGGTPSSDAEGAHARKSKKGKGKMTPPDLKQSQNTKRKRGMKSLSVTPSIHGDDEDDRNLVRYLSVASQNSPPVLTQVSETSEDETRATSRCSTSNPREDEESFQ